MPVDERTFNADVVGWINQILDARPDLPFSRAVFEEHGVSGRRDFTVYARSPQNRPVLTGELKVPDKSYGRNPYDLTLVNDAQRKADQLAVEYFFTWNVNQFVLWRTYAPGVAIINRDLEWFDVTAIRRSDELREPAVEQRVRNWLVEFLERFAEILRGTAPLRNRAPDEKFIRIIEAALTGPIQETFDVLVARYAADPVFRSQIEAWMRDRQGWPLSNDPQIQRDNLLRAARLSSYILMNKLVFYEALRRKFPSLPTLDQRNLGITAADLAAETRHLFQRAMQVSHDYETIFDEDFGGGLPYLSDGAAEGWRLLVEQIHGFDFTRLDYDVIGRIFERLIAPEERHEYGQHYTKPEIVDIINAFCIHHADDLVMDPACGGGTFLVRAYARKSILRRRAGLEPSHQEMLGQLIGTDISQFAVHLTTVNLATRHLVGEANYPRVARKDFFDVRRGNTLITLPVVAEGLGAGQQQDIAIDQLDVVVGNPPYIRQELIGKPQKQKMADLLKEAYRSDPFPPHLSGRSDIHAYFWPHAAAFLKDGGWLGLLTSSTWMDVEYGFRLQEYLLRHFRIVAILESDNEPWFTEARVITAVTILQKEPDAARRDNNLVRFVMLRKPLSALLGETPDEPARQAAAEGLVARILATDENVSTDEWRIRVVSQRDLWAAGTKVTLEAGDEASASDRVAVDDDGDGEAEADAAAEPEPDDTPLPGEYTGSKWGIYLRAPDIYFTLMDRSGNSFVPTGTVTKIRRGITSGKDAFFFVRDITDTEIKRTKTESAFQTKWAMTVADTKQFRIIQAGDGSAHVVEARFLEPEFHRLTEAQRVVVRATEVARVALTVSRPLSRLRGTQVGNYIRYGERQNWHTGSTVKSRRLWYDLAPLPKGHRAEMFWSMSHQYRHVVPRNLDNIISNHNVFDVWAADQASTTTLWAVLNSTIVALHKLQFGRPVGREGNLKTEVIDVKMMLIPDPRRATPAVAARLAAAMEQMAQRRTQNLVDEFALADRRELDDAVLELLGIEDPQERAELRARLYAQLRLHYERARELELQAMANRGAASRRIRGRVTANDLAKEIWAGLDKEMLRAFPDDFLDGDEAAEELDLPPGKLEVGRQMFEFQSGLAAGTVGVDGIILRVGSVARAEFLSVLNECGISGNVRVPLADSVCEAAVQEFREYRDRLLQRFKALAADRTTDDRLQAGIVRILQHEALYWRPTPRTLE